MRINGYEIEAKTFENLSIELDDEYSYMDFYKNKESDYNYIKRKYESNYSKSGYYIGLYENENEKRGYFYVCENMLLKEHYIYKKHTRYMELLEFGFNNNNLKQINFLIDYLYYYCQHSAAQFLKIRTSEKSFEKFYELIKSKFKYTTYKNYIYINIESIKFESLKYLKNYKRDKLTFKELYHLNQIGFVMSKTKGILTLRNGQCIVIDRRTRKLTYPEMFKNLKENSIFNYFNYHSCALIHYIHSHFYDIEDNNIEFDYVIEGLEDLSFIKIGRKLVTLDKDIFIKDYRLNDYVPEFAELVCTKTNILSMDVIVECSFIWKSYYANVGSIWIYLHKYVEDEEVEEEY